MSTLDLFDEHAALIARNEAIARVEAHAEPAWKERALEVVKSLCESVPSFIVDDVWATGLRKPSEARALGAVILQAAKLGYCVGTDQFRPSAQVQCHGNYRREWKSLLYQPARMVANG